MTTFKDNTYLTKIENKDQIINLTIKCIEYRNDTPEYFVDNDKLIAELKKLNKDDLKIVMEWLKRNQQYGYIIKLIGNIYGQIYSDATSELLYFSKSAELGNGHAMYNIGQTYIKNANYEEALKWFKEATENNFLCANTAIGNLYECGWGVAEDHNIALEYYEKGEINGDTDAINSIGMLYFKNDKLKNNEKAVTYFIKGKALKCELSFYYSGLVCEENNIKIGALRNYGKGLALCREHDDKSKYFKKIKYLLKYVGIQMVQEYVAKDDEIDRLTIENDSLKKDLLDFPTD